MNKEHFKQEQARVSTYFSGPSAIFKMLSKTTPRFDKALWWYIDQKSNPQDFIQRMVRRAFEHVFKINDAYLEEHNRLSLATDNEANSSVLSTEGLLTRLQKQTVVINLLASSFFDHKLIVTPMGTHPFKFDVDFINDDVLMVYTLHDKNCLDIFRGATQENRPDLDGLRFVLAHPGDATVFFKESSREYVQVTKLHVMANLALDTTYEPIKEAKYQTFNPSIFKKVFDFLKIDQNEFINKIYEFHLNDPELALKRFYLLEPCLRIFYNQQRISMAGMLIHLGGTKEDFINCLANTEPELKALDLPDLDLSVTM